MDIIRQTPQRLFRLFFRSSCSMVCLVDSDPMDGLDIRNAVKKPCKEEADEEGSGAAGWR